MDLSLDDGGGAVGDRRLVSTPARPVLFVADGFERHMSLTRLGLSEKSVVSRLR
jgi:hypothetical protein